MSTLIDFDLDLDPTSERSGTPHSARRSWQASSLVGGGVLFAVGNALHPLEHNDAAFGSPTWEAAHLLILASIPLLVLGLPVVHRMLRGRVSDRWSLVPMGTTRRGSSASTASRARWRTVPRCTGWPCRSATTGPSTPNVTAIGSCHSASGVIASGAPWKDD
jgi:hypothetical protein